MREFGGEIASNFGQREEEAKNGLLHVYY